MTIALSPGRLFYLMGASGCGKDSLIQAARTPLSGEDSTVFAHRYITRPVDHNSENHIALSDAEFSQRANAGLFLFHWQAHGNRYGIGIEVEDWLAAGFNVIMNGSRAYLPDARERLPALVAISIEVAEEKLAKRLEIRGRESATDVEQRLARTTRLQAAMQPDAVIDNNTSLDASVQTLLNIIRRTAVC